MLTLDQKSANFTAILKEAANAHECVFFEDSGEDNWLETDTLFLENVSGWLVPIERQNEFLASDRNDDKWDSFFVFAEWHKNSEDIKINFKKYPIYT